MTPPDTSRQGHSDAGRLYQGRALGEWLEEFRPRLVSTIRTRLDPILARRVGPEDVVQEAYVEVLDRFDEYLGHQEVELFVWVRFLVVQKLAQTHRKHLGTAARDPHREVRRAQHSGTSISLTRGLLARNPSPSEVAVGGELKDALLDGLDDLRESERELLLLRHFEGLSNGEVAQVLGITERAASMRHVRAVRALGKVLERLDLSHGDFLR